jgi:transposase-like protein
MTDIRCPACSHAFFDHHPEPLLARGESYRCRSCDHLLLVPEADDTVELPVDEMYSTVCCPHDETRMEHVFEGYSLLDGDREAGWVCPTCEAGFSVRLCTAVTATSPEYEGMNPFTTFHECPLDARK